jgi:hypothetical protein
MAATVAFMSCGAASRLLSMISGPAVLRHVEAGRDRGIRRRERRETDL